MRSSVKDVAAQQYREIVDRAASSLAATPPAPSEGWIRTVRRALGMSGAELGRRMGVSRERVSKAEHSEREEAVTLRTMQAAAAAMGCRFVYAIVPESGSVEDLIAEQARRKARSLVSRASMHMALEDQGLSREQNAAEVERVARELVRDMPRDLWSEP